MRSVLVTGPRQWQIADVIPKAPGSGEVRLRPISGGICGGDVDLLNGQNAVAQYPMVLGHECVAVVEESGPDTSFVAGDHVAVYPTISCGQCPACRSGWANHCHQMRTMGLAHPNGCFTDTLTVGAAQCVPVPADMALRYGALIEPVAVGCHVANRAGDMNGARALVIGAGMIGTAVGVVARSRGLDTLLASDLYETRESHGRALGFDGFTTAQGDELIDWVRSASGSVDIVFDTVGTDEVARVGIEVLEPGGRFMALASSKPAQKWTLPYPPFFLKELQVITSRNYRRLAFEEAVAFLAEQRPPLEQLITARYPLEEFGDALNDLLSDPARHVKVMLEPSRG